MIVEIAASLSEDDVHCVVSLYLRWNHADVVSELIVSISDAERAKLGLIVSDCLGSSHSRDSVRAIAHERRHDTPMPLLLSLDQSVVIMADIGTVVAHLLTVLIGLARVVDRNDLQLQVLRHVYEHVLSLCSILNLTPLFMQTLHCMKIGTIGTPLASDQSRYPTGEYLLGSVLPHGQDVITYSMVLS